MARIDDIMDKHSIALDRLTEKQAIQVVSSYRKSAKDLVKDLAIGAGTAGKKQRRRVMLAQVKAGVNQLSDRLGVKVDAATRATSEKAVADLVGMVKVAEPDLGEVAGLIEVEAISNLSKYWGLALHKHSLDRYRADLIAKLQRDMILSTAANETVDEMEDRLKKSLKGMEHRAWLIARMEQSRAYNDAALESMKSTTILPGGMLKKIHETADTRNHPFSRASHGVIAKPDEPFRVSVAKVMAAGKLMDKPTGGILWKQVGGFFVGQNLPGHFGERGRVVPWREEWGGKSEARATAKAARKRHEEKEAKLGHRITRKKKPVVKKPESALDKSVRALDKSIRALEKEMGPAPAADASGAARFLWDHENRNVEAKRKSMKVLKRMAGLSSTEKKKAHMAVWGKGGRSPAGFVKSFRKAGSTPGGKEVKKALDGIPAALKKKALDNGNSVEIYNLLGEWDPSLLGVRPRGWPPGTSWDDVRGLASRQKAVIATRGVQGGSSFTNVTLHEFGHTIENALGDAAEEAWWVDIWKAAMERDVTTTKFGITRKTNALERWARANDGYDSSGYFQQDPPAGADELWAEVMARAWESPGKRALLDEHFPGMLDAMAERIYAQWF